MKRDKIKFGLLIAVFICLTVLGNDPGVYAQSDNRVGLVVQFGDGHTLTRCVTFTEPEISGYEVLIRSGLNIVAANSAGVGAAICQIEGEGCPAENCFCKCRGTACTYWSYWQLDGEAWSYSNLGASASTVHPGAVEGWHWGVESPPPVLSFDQICAPAATPTLPPPSVNLSVVPTTIVAGECAQLNWQVKNVQAVYLDGNGVGGKASKQVCPAQTQVYELRVVSAQGESRYTVTLNVIPPTATPTATFTAMPTPTKAQTSQTATPSPTITTTSPEHTPTASPTSSATPTATPTATRPATATSTATRTATPTPRPLLTYIPTSSSNRPAPTATPAESTTISTEHLVFVACLVFLLIVLIITIKRK